jgi:KaiC/GvpD/RAD55 family RecA-like ATPase
MIREMEDEKVAEQVIPKVTEMINNANIEQAATLIADIMSKYFEWLNK